MSMDREDFAPRSYTIGRWEGPEPEIDGREFDPAREPFCARPFAAIDRYVWDPEGYCPEARAYVARTAKGLQVLMCAREAEIIARETRVGGAVCRDSCLEFFLCARPSEGDLYLNIEVNAAGVAHIGLGTGRHGRRVFEAVPEGMDIRHSRHAGQWWAVCYNIPEALLIDCFGGAPEAQMRGNFYTCDETIHPHFGSWSPVRAPQPDFHRPECFGCLNLEA